MEKNNAVLFLGAMLVSWFVGGFLPIDLKVSIVVAALAVLTVRLYFSLRKR